MSARKERRCLNIIYALDGSNKSGIGKAVVRAGEHVKTQFLAMQRLLAMMSTNLWRTYSNDGSGQAVHCVVDLRRHRERNILSGLRDPPRLCRKIFNAALC